MPSQRILLIEHDPRTREVIVGWLSGRGHTVIDVDNANAGLDLFELGVPELVIVDESLPWMSGLEVALRLRATMPDQAIVFLSEGSEDGPGSAQARIDCGLEHFVGRPLDEARLLSVVEAALSTVVARARQPIYGELGPIDTAMFLVESDLMTADIEAIDAESAEGDAGLFAWPDDEPAVAAVPFSEDLGAELSPDEAAEPDWDDLGGAALSSEGGGIVEFDSIVPGSSRCVLRPMTPTSPSEPHGIYGEASIGELLFLAFRDIFSGRLVVRSGNVEKSITLRNGYPTDAMSNVRSEEVLWRLTLDGRITVEQQNDVRTLIDLTDAPLGQTLSHLGVIEPVELLEMQRRVARERILSCFTLPHGSYGLTTDAGPSSHGADQEMDPLVLIFEGIKRLYPVAPLVEHFDAFCRRQPRRTEKLRELSRHFRDYPDELRFAELLDGQKPLGHVLAQSPFGLVETLRVLRAFEITQCVEYGRDEAVLSAQPSPAHRRTVTAEPSPGPAPGPRKVGPPSRSMPVVTTSPRAAPVSPSVPAPPAPPAPRSSVSMMPPATSPTGSTAPQAGLLSPRHTSQPSPAAGLMTDPAMPKVNIEAAFRAEVTEKLRRMSEGTAYDVLDVQPTASVDALRNAYVRLTKLYHPDRTATFQDDNLREQAFEVQRRLVTAWEAVKDPRARQDYDASNLSGPVDDGGGKPDIIKADFNFQRGKACLGKGDAKRGLEFLEVASRQDPHQPLYRIYRGWARFLASDASDIKAKTEAREDIKIALKIDESLDAGYLFLGHISKATANDELAEKLYRKTVQINPNNADGWREIRLYEARRAKDKQKDGLLGKLFTKK